MYNHFHFRLALVLFSASVALPTAGYCKGASMAAKSEKNAVKNALKQELSRATPDHIKVSRFKVTSLDVRSNWALAEIVPQDQDIDSVSVLLHKVGGRWKVVTLGSNLLGTGKQYHVPRSLWNRWHLGL